MPPNPTPVSAETAPAPSTRALAPFAAYGVGRPPFSPSDFCAQRSELGRRTGGPSGAYEASATYSLSPAVACVAETPSPASDASRHFQSVKAGWS